MTWGLTAPPLARPQSSFLPVTSSGREPSGESGLKPGEVWCRGWGQHVMSALQLPLHCLLLPPDTLGVHTRATVTIAQEGRQAQGGTAQP